MILAPHPDDESLGCGGLIAQCCAAGRPPVVVILTDGAASHPGSRSHPQSRLRRLRAEEARHAVEILGLGEQYLVFLGYSDAGLPHEGPAFKRAVEQLVNLAKEQGCEIVIGPWAEDSHCDHQAAAAMTAAAAAALDVDHLFYPVWGWLLPAEKDIMWIPKRGWRLPIARELPLKRRAVAAHETQYGGVITDAPAGFQLPAALLKACLRPYEVFLEA